MADTHSPECEALKVELPDEMVGGAQGPWPAGYRRLSVLTPEQLGVIVACPHWGHDHVRIVKRIDA